MRYILVLNICVMGFRRNWQWFYNHNTRSLSHAARSVRVNTPSVLQILQPCCPRSLAGYANFTTATKIGFCRLVASEFIDLMETVAEWLLQLKHDLDWQPLTARRVSRAGRSVVAPVTPTPVGRCIYFRRHRGIRQPRAMPRVGYRRVSQSEDELTLSGSCCQDSRCQGSRCQGSRCQSSRCQGSRCQGSRC